MVDLTTAGPDLNMHVCLLSIDGTEHSGIRSWQETVSLCNQLALVKGTSTQARSNHTVGFALLYITALDKMYLKTPSDTKAMQA